MITLRIIAMDFLMFIQDRVLRFSEELQLVIDRLIDKIEAT